jgi:hypothetical protein
MIFTLSGYEIGELLGRGSCAEVWSARRTRDGQAVALKRIAASAAPAAAQAGVEAALLAELDHPNLVGLIEFIVSEDHIVLVMELAAGGSLAELLRRRGKLTPPEVAAALSPVAAALAHAHERGVVHRDISAGNVLFTATGHPQLADLGVARLTAARYAESGVVGTPAYLDPGIAAGGVGVPASDVFSLGAVALHALSGLGPWQESPNDSVEQVLSRAATGSLPDLVERLSGCPRDMAATVIRALELEPYRRGTAAEFALDLRASIDPSPVVLSAGRMSGARGRHSTEGSWPGQPAPNPRASGQLSRQSSDLPAGQQPFRAIDGPAEAPRGAPGRHAARPNTNTANAGHAANAGHGGQPSFSRPRREPLIAVEADLTRIAARSTLRPVQEAAKPARRLSGHRWHVAGAGAAVVALIAAVVLLSTGAVRAGGGAGAGGAEPRMVAAAPTSSVRTAVLDSATALAELRRLDALRAAAYATRRAELLAVVYDSPVLLARDRTQLLQRVPAGCTLTGLITRFSGVRILSADRSRVQLAVTAKLGAADLHCSGASVATAATEGRTSGRTASSAATELVIVLSQRGSQRYAIASQRLAGT